MRYDVWILVAASLCASVYCGGGGVLDRACASDRVGGWAGEAEGCDGIGT
jgi:hypothetical protein